VVLRYNGRRAGSARDFMGQGWHAPGWKYGKAALPLSEIVCLEEHVLDHCTV